MANALTKANSEAASYKKKMKEAMDNATAATSETEKLNQRIADLEKLNEISAKKAQCLASGFSDEQAEQLATACADGDMDKILEILSAFLADREKAIKAEIMKQTPKPVSGNSEKESDTTVHEESFWKSAGTDGG